MAALRRAGPRRSSAHKVGPDYIDPGYHALATGRPGPQPGPVPGRRGADRAAAPARRAPGADIAVVEGVMGLYDGAAGPASRVRLHRARRRSCSARRCVLVVDARRPGRSVAALVHGFALLRPAACGSAGVILNRVGSDRHEAMLREALDEAGVPVLGALRRDRRGRGTPSRHLGLVPAAERARRGRPRPSPRSAALVAAPCDLDAVLRAGPLAPPARRGRRWDPAAAVGPRRRPARWSRSPAAPAFTFRYAETAELLAAAGAEVVTVRPAARRAPCPTARRGLVLGGGFPEVHAARAVRQRAAARRRRGAGRRAARRSPPSAPGCCTWPGRWTATRCAACSTREAAMTPQLTLGYRRGGGR